MRTVILTGSTGGLGRCLVREICGLENADLICTYRDEAKFHRIHAGNKKAFREYRTAPGDNYRSLCKQINEGSEELVVILNAFSIAPLKPVGRYEVDEIDSMIDGNIKQTVHLLNRVMHFCNERNKKLRIINLDSGAADLPLTGWGNYCAAKAYVNAFLGVLALENPEHKVVSLDPGVMDTDMQRRIRETPLSVFNRGDEFRDYFKNGVLRKPEDVARYIVDRYVKDWKAINLREKLDR